MSFTTSQALTSPNTHLRSQLFNPKFGVNSMVTAAQPLLSLLRRIQSCPADQLNPQTLQAVAHETATFEHRLKNHHYDSHSIHMASMLTSWSIFQVFKTKNLSPLPRLTGQSTVDVEPPSIDDNQCNLDKVNPLLSELLAQPRLYLDVTELAYFCLTDFSPQTSQQASRQLFDSIQTHREPSLTPKPTVENDCKTTNRIALQWTWNRRKTYGIAMATGVVLCLSLLCTEFAIHFRANQLLTATATSVTPE